MQELSQEDFLEACKKIASWARGEGIRAVWGIPRGGLIPAVHISHLLDVPIAPFAFTPGCLVIDDIADSGTTISQWAYCTTATIFYSKESIVEPDFWVYEKKEEFIKFPWETDNTARIDYKEEEDERK